MPVSIRGAAIAALSVILPDLAQAAPVTAEAIEAATYSGGALPPGQNALTVKVQVMLDRSGISPGVIDEIKGGMSRSAIAAFERRSGLPADGVMDAQVWAALQPYAGAAMTADYTITEADASELTRFIPTDYIEKANMTSLGYTSVAEKLGERFHMDENFIETLNPGIPLVAGSVIKVIAPSKPLRAKVTRIFVDKGTNRVSAYDASGHMVVNYPATIGSADTPSPSGVHTVRAVAMNPEYTYNPSINFTQGDNKSVLTLPPGPNGPVGSVWIALSKPTYGLHGTPSPSRLFVSKSHGCVRLTNWDADELAHMVQPGVTTVEFLERGSSLAAAVGDTIAAGTGSSAPANGVTAAASLVLASSRPPLPKPAALAGQPAQSAVPTQPAAVPANDPLAAAVDAAVDAMPGSATAPVVVPAPASVQ